MKPSAPVAQAAPKAEEPKAEVEASVPPPPPSMPKSIPTPIVATSAETLAKAKPSEASVAKPIEIPLPPAFVAEPSTPPVAIDLTAEASVEEIPAPPPVPSQPRPELRSLLLSTWDAFRPAPDPTAVAKMTPAVAARRAQLTKYVKGVVAGCAALCLIALVRVAVASASEPEDLSHAGRTMTKAHAGKSLEAAVEELKAVHVMYALRATSHHR